MRCKLNIYMPAGSSGRPIADLAIGPCGSNGGSACLGPFEAVTAQSSAPQPDSWPLSG